MPANNHFGRRVAHVLGGKRFVSCAILQKAAAVDARFVAENRLAGHGLFGRKRTARRMRDQIAQRGKLPRFHAAIRAQREPCSHDDLVQRRIAGAFAKAVDGDARGIRAGSERGDGIRRRHAKVVVPVKFQAQIRCGYAQ